jgi:hypothetical protein
MASGVGDTIDELVSKLLTHLLKLRWGEASKALWKRHGIDQ